MRTRISSLATAFACLPLIAPLARAQDDPAEIAYDLSVTERPLNNQGPGFARLGGWTLTPRLDLGLRYDDNIYATPNDEIDDLITTIVPVASLASDWNRHQVEFEAGGSIGLYETNTDEDYHDYYFQNSTVLDVVQGTQLSTDLLYRHAYTPRTSSANIGAAKEPLTYDQRAASLGLKRDISIFTLSLSGGIDRLTYAKSQAIGGGTINNSDQDRTQTNLGMRLGYEPIPTATAYLGIGYQDVDYDDPTRFGGPDRNNSGFSIDLGGSKTISDLWVIDLAIGYKPRNFADSSLEDISGLNALTLRGDVLWNPTALTSVMGTLSRQTYETTEPGASAIVSTFGALNVEHQLLQSLVITAGLDYNDSEYDGSSRNDRDFGLSAGLNYTLTRFASLRAEYSYRERDSTDNTADYDKNLAQIALRLSF